jgi:tryptophan-rich sensory protein
MLRNYKKDKTKSKRSKLPQLSLWFFNAIWEVLFVAVLISLYIYFDGNCRFNRFRFPDEDDEVGNIDYIRGLLVFIFSLLVCWLNRKWAVYMFVLRWFRLALLVLSLMIAMSVVMLWAMATTNPCARDELANRYWICFALYLLYSAWLVVAFFVNYRWMKTIGPWLDKNDSRYATFKREKFWRRVEEKKDRYPEGHKTMYHFPPEPLEQPGRYAGGPPEGGPGISGPPGAGGNGGWGGAAYYYA